MKKFLFLAVFLLLLPSTSHAAIAMDNASSSMWTGTGDITHKLLIGATSTMVVVGVVNSNNVGDTVTGVTASSTSGKTMNMTLIAKRCNSTPCVASGFDFTIYLYAASTTNLGTGNIQIQTQGASGAGVFVGAASYSGTATTIPTNFTVNSVNGSSLALISATNTPTAITSWLVGLAAENNTGNDSWTSTLAVNKSRSDDGPGPARSLGDSNGTATTTSQVTSTWQPGASPDWNIITAELLVAPAVAGTPTPSSASTTVTLPRGTGYLLKGTGYNK